MIDFQILPRQFGKTTELIEMFNKNPGLFFTNYTIRDHLILGGMRKTFFYAKGILRSSIADWYYFDDFCSQDDITFSDIIELEKRNKNIIIRSSPGGYNPPDYFLKYIKENYPEYVI